MTMIKDSTLLTTLLVAALLATGGCNGPNTVDAAEDAGDETHAAAATNRIAVPPTVRENLGITFAPVDLRRVEQTIRVPGRFELLPTARREYRTMLPGRIELLVEQFDRVDAGRPLYRMDSSAWRDLQQRLNEAVASIRRHEARLATFAPLLSAHAQHAESLDASIEVWSDRVEQIDAVRAAGGGRVNELAAARSSLASAQALLAEVHEKEAQLVADKAQTEAELEAAIARRQLLLDSAATLLDMPTEALTTSVETPQGTKPRWLTIDSIVVSAEEAGIVETLGVTNGAWTDEKTPVVTIVRPERVRFEAQGLQSDLGVLDNGLMARIVPPSPTRAGSAIDLLDTMRGTLSLGISGDPSQRTIPLYVVPETRSSWALPGVSAQLEIVVDASAEPTLAIPLAAVQRDGLDPVIFRRDPRDANTVIRVEADLGLDDGRWVVVKSGLRRGDEVVLDGAFQLMLASSGTMQRGGHFHADGTFHEGDD